MERYKSTPLVKSDDIELSFRPLKSGRRSVRELQKFPLRIMVAVGLGAGAVVFCLLIIYFLGEGPDLRRPNFSTKAEYVTSLTPQHVKSIRLQLESQGRLEELRRLDLVLKHYQSLGPKSILAWDYVRYISLCRMAYSVGYLTESEAWERIIPIACILQKTFDSWPDLGKNYMIGRQFWTPIENPDIKKGYQTLLSDPLSPWNTIPWDLKLNENGR